MIWMKTKLPVTILFAVVFFFSCDYSTPSDQSRNLSTGMVVSAHSEANQVGHFVLQNGGNAFDAAVAVNMMLAVTYPRAGNIGGGGFMVYRTKDGQVGSLDFREKAPLKASEKMYLDAMGHPQKNKSRFGGLSAGVPGTTAGMVALHERFGAQPWNRLIEPAIKYAKQGFAINRKQAQLLNRFQNDFRNLNHQDCPLLNDTIWIAGDTLRNIDLAKTLQSIAEYKEMGFYSGHVARDIVNSIQAAGGIISLEDLKNYEVVWRDPMVGTFKDYTIISMPPPSSGGIALLQLLKGFELKRGDTLPLNSAAYIHLLTELERRVYADRAEYLGDPDFFKVPISNLLNASYLEQRFSDIDMNKATPSTHIKKGEVEQIESFETTHFQIMDQWGNAVAITTTLNGNFGSKLMTDSTGIIINNQMDDFSIKPGVPNQFGLVGSEANRIHPEKRMLSSMTPTLVLKNDSLVLVTGTPGGATIITSVFQTLLNTLVYQLNAQQAVDQTKFHAQWLPDKIYHEHDRLDASKADSLIAMGHQLDSAYSLGKMKLFVYQNGEWNVASDALRGDP